MFKKNKYQICRKMISEEMSEFLFNYLIIKKQTFHSLQRNGVINNTQKLFGSEGDAQIPNSYSVYGDIAMDTLLAFIMTDLEKKTKLKLAPTYTYTRLYKNGDTLKKHRDRASCEISATLNLGGEVWPIYLEDKKGKQIKVKLTPGDLLIYKGIELSHWRKPFKGFRCGQVFLHYKDKSKKGWEKFLFDTRPHLGYPLKN